MYKQKKEGLMNITEIAAQLHLSEAVVSKALKSALKKLKVKLSELEDFEEYHSDTQNQAHDS